MRGTTTAAVALVVIAVLSSSARAVDPPGLALAKRVVDEVRGAAHKEKMRIVWPERVETTPPEGAEVVLIDGYISYAMTRLVWRDGKVDARAVSTSRTWFYNEKGEDYGAFEFDVDPAAFATAWSAALYVAGARDERIEPEPTDHPNSRSSSLGSHESHKWTRLRVGDAPEPLFFGDACGKNSRNWEGVREWDGVRDKAAWKCLEALLPKKDALRTAAPAAWKNVVTDEIRRATSAPQLEWRGEHGLLLEVCLRVVGEFGDADALDAVDQLDARLAKGDGDAYVVGNLRDETEIARAKLRLSARWDSAEATRRIRSNPHEKHWQDDLAKWVRRRFREQNAAGYLDLLVHDVGYADVRPDDGEIAITELRAWPGADGKAAWARLMKNAGPNPHLAAACAALDADPKDAKAAAALIAIADDRTIRPPSYTVRFGWSRTNAIVEAGKRGLLGPVELRARLVDPRPEHAFVVHWTLDTITRWTKEPATDDERRTAWRRVVDGPVELGVRHGVVALLELRDTASSARMTAAIDRMQAALVAKAPGSEDLDADFLGRLRVGVETMNAGPTPPK